MRVTISGVEESSRPFNSDAAMQRVKKLKELLSEHPKSNRIRDRKTELQMLTKKLSDFRKGLAVKWSGAMKNWIDNPYANERAYPSLYEPVVK